MSLIELCVLLAKSITHIAFTAPPIPTLLQPHPHRPNARKTHGQSPVAAVVSPYLSIVAHVQTIWTEMDICMDTITNTPVGNWAQVACSGHTMVR